MSNFESMQDLLADYDNTCAALQSLEEILEKVRTRRDDLERRLDAATLPEPGARSSRDRATGVLAAGPTRSTEPPLHFRCDGRFIRTYVAVLSALFTRYPERVGAIERAFATRGRSRRYLARDPDALFSGKSREWREKHSRQLVPGWYIDTNHNRSTIRDLTQMAVEALGLVPGADIIIEW